jgi:transcriptional regulator with XRE-family HTH domain
LAWRMSIVAGHYLRERREALGMTQTEVAERTGLTRQTVRLIEAGRIDRPHRLTVNALARVLVLPLGVVRTLFTESKK